MSTEHPTALPRQGFTCGAAHVPQAAAQGTHPRASGPVGAQAHWPPPGALPPPAVAMAAPAPGFISVFSSPQELSASLAQLVAQRAASCVAGARARFALGLSGGSLVSMLARELPAAIAPAGPGGLAHWTLGFCDERLVPFEHAESTYGLYRVRATGAAEGHTAPRLLLRMGAGSGRPGAPAVTPRLRPHCHPMGRWGLRSPSGSQAGATAWAQARREAQWPMPGTQGSSGAE